MKISADGGTYIREDSYVLVSRSGSKIDYTVRLVETTKGGDVYGIDAEPLEILEKEGTSLLDIRDLEGYNLNIATPDSIKTMDPFYSMCTEVEAVYN